MGRATFGVVVVAMAVLLGACGAEPVVTAGGTSTSATTVPSDPKRAWRVQIRPVLTDLPPPDATPFVLPSGETVPGPSYPDSTTGVVAPDVAPIVSDARSATTSGAIERRVELGPALVLGSAIERAVAAESELVSGEWVVNLTFREGAGIDGFNAAAEACFEGHVECPTKRLAFLIDGGVITDPSINAATFARDQVQISGSFGEAGARAAAGVINAAAG